MPNVKSTISSHIYRALKNNNVATTSVTCNCRGKIHCPHEGKCLTTSVVYKAAITTKDTHQTKNYISVTARQFKYRYNNHRNSLNNYAYRKETELSKYVWELKDQGKDFDIKWSVVQSVPAYSAGGGSCKMCLEEKLLILKSNKEHMLNKRKELSLCHHKNRFSPKNSICNSNCKRKWQSNVTKTS